MTKKTFLRKLATKLDVLKEEEKKDIIAEYEGHIDEKIKQGKTEKEAVADFGDIDDLADEILDAYKIKGRNKEDESKFDAFINEFVYTAKEVFQNIGKSMSEDTVGFIFKILFLLILIGLLRIPFYIIEAIGSGIFRTLTFGPIGTGTIWLWRVVVEISYAIVVILIGASMLGKSKKLDELAEKVKAKHNETKEEPKKTKKEQNKETQIEKTKPEPEKTKTRGFITWTFLIIFRIFAVLFVIPFFFTQIGFVITLGVLIKFAFEGVIIWGLLAIMLGLVGIMGVLIEFIIKIAFKPASLGMGMLVSVVISFLLIGFGSSALVFDVMNYEYINEIPEHNYETKTESYSYTLDQVNKLTYDYGSHEVIYDDTLTDEVIIEVTYIPELGTLEIFDSEEPETIIVNIHNYYYTFGDFKSVYNLILEDIKDKEIHNYIKLFAPEYKIYINPEKKEEFNINTVYPYQTNQIEITDKHIYIESQNGDTIRIGD